MVALVAARVSAREREECGVHARGVDDDVIQVQGALSFLDASLAEGEQAAQPAVRGAVGGPEQ